MPDTRPTSFSVGIAGHGACIPDTAAAQALDIRDAELDLSLLPAMVRRRTSEATRIAISAATRACRDAGSTLDMPGVFVSAIGEAATTEKLCQSITQCAFPLSPTLFHNSVHNTAAGYWSIAAKSMAPMQAMSALNGCVTLGLLEAWTQIVCGAERVLLVCYDESTPRDWPPGFDWQPSAMALVLEAASARHPSLRVPLHADRTASADCLTRFAQHNPIADALPLVAHLQRGQPGRYVIALDPCIEQGRGQLEIA